MSQWYSFSFLKKSNDKDLSKKDSDIINSLIDKQLSEVEILINKTNQLSREMIYKIWKMIYINLSETNINIKPFQIYMHKHTNQIPLEPDDVQRYLLTDVYLKLKRQYYIEEFYEISQIVKSVYEPNKELLSTVNDTLNDLHEIKQDLPKLRGQQKHGTERLEIRRVQNIKEKLAKQNIQLKSIEDRLDSLSRIRLDKSHTASTLQNT